MSINQYEFSHIQETQDYAWWTQQQQKMQQQTQISSNGGPFRLNNQKQELAAAAADHTGQMFCFNLNNEEEEFHHETTVAGLPEIETGPDIISPLFEKPLTPSDVGKLNRLVIPKQHAEKYFPMNGAAESGENALLLGFEDEAGKSWRFRYSYWNSSQSYVLTKGWSRFVKDKQLDAGDVVVFSRHRDDTGRLFIGWRRRNSNQDSAAAAVAAGGSWNRAFYSNHSYPTKNPSPTTTGSSVPHQKQPLLQSPNGNNSKRLLRLFGVNLECQADDSEPSSNHECSSSSSMYHHQYYPNHMDMISFSGGRGTGDMVYRQG